MRVHVLFFRKASNSTFTASCHSWCLKVEKDVDSMRVVEDLISRALRGGYLIVLSVKLLGLRMFFLDLETMG